RKLLQRNRGSSFYRIGVSRMIPETMNTDSRVKHWQLWLAVAAVVIPIIVQTIDYSNKSAILSYRMEQLEKRYDGVDELSTKVEVLSSKVETLTNEVLRMGNK